MPSQVRAAGAGANDASFGTNAWANPGNVLASDNTRSDVTQTNAITQYLKTSSHGFAIPAGATIDGIIVRVERLKVSGSGSAEDERVRLVKAGTVQATDKAAVGSAWPTTEATASYGGATDLWGGAWTADDINAAGFGMVIAVESVGQARPAIDYIEIEVFYTETGGTAPTVTGLSPNEGPTGGGTSVVITGTAFTGATAVKFGANNATSFTVDSATQITAVAPAGAAGTVDVTVTTPNGTSPTTGTGNDYTYRAVPSVTGLNPTSGPEGGGTSVVITGTGFTGATAVKFGANNATSFTVDSATQITAVAPAGTGTVDVTVTTAGGTSSTAGAGNDYTYTAAPPPPSAGVRPTVAVEVAFAKDPFSTPVSADWTAITSYVRRLRIRRGRQHELARTETGELDLELDNRDRRFDPTNTASPYSPNLLPMRRVRVRATYAGTTRDLFSGFIEGWPQLWPPRPRQSQGDAEVRIKASDAFKLLNLHDLVPYSREVLADEPLLYVRFRDPPGTTRIQSEGSAEEVAFTPRADYRAPTLGAPGPLIGGAGSTEFPSNQERRWNTPYTDQLKIGRGDMTLEAWVYLDPTATGDVFAIRDESTTSVAQLGLGVDGPTRGLIFEHYTETSPGVASPFASREMTSNVIVPTGSWQHVAAVRDVARRTVSYYLNGALQETRSYEGDALDRVDSFRLSIGLLWVGRLAHVAVYPAALTAERIAAHYSRVYDEFTSQLSGSFVNAVLDAVGWPAGERTVDAGSSLVTATPDGNALDSLLQVAEDSEGGLLHVTRDGKVLFHDRHSLVKPPHLSAQATFGDGAGELNYHDLELQFDDTDLYTKVRVERDGGAAEASDAAASTKYGPRTLVRSGSKVASDSEAQDAANYWLTRFKAPLVRFPRLVLRGVAGADSLWAQMLDRDIHYDRITVKRRPPGGGAVIQADVHIEGLEYDVTPPASWEVIWALVPADPTTYWLLGDSALGILGTTSRLGW